MEADVLKAIAQAAGIGGIALGTLLLVFRDIIRRKVFPQLDRDRGYRLLRLIALLTWSVALVGIAAWAWVETRPVVATDPVGPDVSIQADRSAVSAGDMSGPINIYAPTTIEQSEQGPSR